MPVNGISLYQYQWKIIFFTVLLETKLSGTKLETKICSKLLIATMLKAIFTHEYCLLYQIALIHYVAL